MECKLVLAGYFGCGNLGDDAILAGFLEGIADIPARVTVLSGHPEATRRAYSVGAIHRMNFAATAEALKGAEALVFPGGSIFQDVTSIRSIFYYTKLVSIGKRVAGRVILLGQGFGPVRTWSGRLLARSALRKVDAIAVRDEESGRTAAALGAACEIALTADMAWLAKPDAGGEGAFGIGEQGAVGLVPRLWKKNRQIADAFAGLARHLSAKDIIPILVPLEESDSKIANQMASRGYVVPTVMKGIRDPRQMMARMERFRAVVSMRYHGAVFAAKAGIPPLLISYDPKISGLATSLGLPRPIPVEGLTAERLIAAWDEHETRLPEMETMMRAKRPILVTRAQENIELLCKHVPSLAHSKSALKQP